MAAAGGLKDPKADFELICSGKANDLIPVIKFRSKSTGITVVVAQVEGPVVNGFFCLATETHDDDGLPHTLEHLIFLGSEKYPYKGVLDLLANRCLASGTNAWTDTDHTCYTVTTAGSEGFLTLLPVYLDHILYPTLSDSGFITEVHHVNGQGENAGVVYCEMQGKENTGESRTHRAMLMATYPGNCGYKSTTGGILKNLRESTNNDEVRKYHSDFYRPENLCLIITGQVEPKSVFAALQPLQEKILQKGLKEEFKRPWQDPVPPLKESADLLVPYACDEEDNGMVIVAWRGPSAVSELTQMFALMMLMEYLTDTAVSPLQKEFVELDDPYASIVAYSCIENSETTFFLFFENVPVNKINKVKSHLMSTLETIGSDPASLDMKRMDAVIHRKILEQLSNLENSPHESVACMIIGDVLYGRNQEDLNQRLNQVEDLKRFRKEPASFWIGLLRTYLLEQPSVTVRGQPSLLELERTMMEEKARVEAQMKALGSEGLKKKSEELLKAMEENEVPPPEDMVHNVPVPDMSSIKFHPIKTYESGTKQQHPKFPLGDLPMFCRLDDVHSNFVHLIVLLDTTCIPRELKPFLPLLTEALLESPVQRGSELIPFEEVVAELASNTLRFAARLGLDIGSRFSCGAYAQTMSLLLQVEIDKYERGVEWLQEILYQTRFTSERLKVIATKMANDVAQLKRKGSTMTQFLMRDICFGKDSNFYNSSLMRQLSFLTKLCEQLESSPDEVMNKIEQVRQLLVHPENMMVHLAMSVDLMSKAYQDLTKVWKEKMILRGQPKCQKSLTVVPDHSLLMKREESPTNGCVVGLGSVESSYLIQTVPSITDYNDPDFPAVLVFIQYLTQLEGPLWRQIRGQGLAYGYTINARPNEGLMSLSLYKSTHVVAAYTEAQRIIMLHLSGEEPWKEGLLESAKSSLIFELIENEKSVGDIIIQSLLSYFKGVDDTYYRKLLQLVSKVSGEDMTRVGKKYVAPLLDMSKSRCAVVCHTSKVQEVVAGFKELGRELCVCPSLEESFLSKW